MITKCIRTEVVNALEKLLIKVGMKTAQNKKD